MKSRVLDRVLGVEGDQLEMRPPTITYKLGFLVGGMGFAVVTYVAGIWLYSLEHMLWGRELNAVGLDAMIRAIPIEHPITFYPWVIGTTSLAVLLGYLFDQQVKLRSRLEVLAVTDGLTLLYNHRFFIQQLSLQIKRTGHTQEGFAVLLVDIDDFKRYNDTYGHLAGDDVLRLVGQAIRSCIRETDTVARYGGEEFVVMAEDSTGDQALMLAERIRERIEHSTPITASVGVSIFPVDGETVNELIRVADEAMYSAKHKGKNQVFFINRQADSSTALEALSLKSIA